jgi:hypothetical protein
VRRARPRPRGADLRRPHVHPDLPATTSGSRARSRRSRASAESRPSCRASRRRSGSPTSPSASPRGPRRPELGVPAPLRGGGLDLAMVNPNHITPYSEIADEERELADDLVFNRREDALERFIGTSSPRARSGGGGADPTEGMEPEEALHWHILRRKKDGRGGLDRPQQREDRRGSHPQRGPAAGDEGGRRQVRRRGADPAVRPPVGRGDEARRGASWRTTSTASRATRRARW